MNGLHVGKGEVYERDTATLKQYREDYFRITLHKMLRRTGYEAVDGEPSRKGRKNTAGNSAKLEESLSRTKSTVFELALCNPWEWFVTLTLNPEYHDRKDIKTYKKKLPIWIKNYNRLHDTAIKYLLIPEQHKNGSWHMHGLMMGLPKEHLESFQKKDKLPIKILIELEQGHTIYNWPAYQRAFGYITISKIRSAEGVSKYITKYLTKDMAKTRIDLNDHLYYCSQGLKRAKKLYQGPLSRELNEDYSNEYVKIKTVTSFEEAIQYFIDNNEQETEW